MERRMYRLFLVVGCPALLLAGSLGQATNANTPALKRSKLSGEDDGFVALGVKASLLGIGAEGAVRATHRTNLRAGFNVLGYSRDFNKDGINYHGHLTFRTVEAHYDIFLAARAFHVSPGLLAYMGNPITAHAVVPGNQSFTLGGHTFYSDPAAPARASGRVIFNQVAPTISVGWGNLVHRDSKRFSVPFELGVAFQGSPKSNLKLVGRVCDLPGIGCRSAISDPTVQARVVSEEAKIDQNIRPFKVYPMISLGFGYKF